MTLVPDPDEYDAIPSVAPVSRVRVGEPVTYISSLNVISIVMTSPALYEPLAVLAVTFVTTGGVMSTSIVVVAAR